MVNQALLVKLPTWVADIKCFTVLYGYRQAKKSLGARSKCADSHHPAHGQSLIQAVALHSIVSHDLDSGQWRPRSDCAFAQSDLGLHCPHVTWRHLFAWLCPYLSCLSTQCRTQIQAVPLTLSPLHLLHPPSFWHGLLDLLTYSLLQIGVSVKNQ